MATSITSGVYALVNGIDGHFYIGSARDLAHRRRCHRWDFRHGRHPNRGLREAAALYGADVFRFVVLAEMPAVEAVAAEGRIVARLWGHPLLYNQVRTPRGSGGLARTPEQREWMAAMKQGQKQSQATKDKRAAALRGRDRSPEAIERSRATFRVNYTGRSPEWIAKQSASHRGKPWSDARRKAQRP